MMLGYGAVCIEFVLAVFVLSHLVETASSFQHFAFLFALLAACAGSIIFGVKAINAPRIIKRKGIEEEEKVRTTQTHHERLPYSIETRMAYRWWLRDSIRDGMVLFAWPIIGLSILLGFPYFPSSFD